MKRIDQWKAKLKVAKAELRIRDREANAAVRALMRVRGTIIELPPVMSTFELLHKKERHG